MKRPNVGTPTKTMGAIAAATALIGSILLASPAMAAPGDVVLSVAGTQGNLSVTGTVTADCEAGTGAFNLNVTRVDTAQPAVLSLLVDGPFYNTNITDPRTITDSFSLTGTAGSSTSIGVGAIVAGEGEEFDYVSIFAGSIDCPAPPFEAESTVTLSAQYDGVDSTCYTEGVDANPPLVAGTRNEVEGERITAIYVDGVPLVGDGENRRLPGTYSYTYDVTNLATNEVDAGIAGGTFTVVACEEEVTEPSITNVSLTPSSDGSGVDYSVTVDLGDSEGKTVLIAHTEEPNARLEFTESGPQTGSFDLACGTYEFGVFFEDSIVGPGQTYTVTIECDNAGGETPVNPGTPAEPSAPQAPAAPANPVDTTDVTSGQYQTDDVYFASSMDTKTLGLGLLLAAGGLGGLALLFAFMARPRRAAQSVQG